MKEIEVLEILDEKKEVDLNKEKKKKKQLPKFIYFFLLLAYLEIIFSFGAFSRVSLDMISVLLISLPIALLLTIISSLGPKVLNKLFIFIFTISISLIYAAQFIHYKYYESIFSIYSLVNGGQVLGFLDSIIETISDNIYFFLILLLPILLISCLSIFISGKKYKFKTNLLLLIIFILSQILIFFGVKLFDKGNYSINKLYHSVHAPTQSVQKMGIITTMAIDLERLITNFSEASVELQVDKEEKVEQVKYNTIEIDFDTLITNETDKTIKNMHKYFSSLSGTNQNDYTGLFKGKNLIVFTAEAFNTIAIDENLTPTLYKMYNEGFKFNNFYTPLFYVSTSDGEYVSLTSLIPKEGVWSMKKSSNNYLPYTYGNMFKNLGYKTYAYHNGNYKYYGRHLSHPNMGYSTYKACGKGLKIKCKKWPQSDLEMIEKTTSDYINDEHFMAYYMTVSGHLNYNFYGNNMAYKNKSYVEDLPYSTEMKAYLATQIELDKALGKLISVLEEHNKLDDTVIILSADHYPYGLTYNEIKERATWMTDKKFDIHKNSFLIWNNNTTSGEETDKYASSLDILPTMLNLFGMEYDSRLLMGSDIFSDNEGLVIFNDRSWITEKGKYNALKKKFVPFVDNVEDKYIEEINNKVYNKFVMSKSILEKNYYKKLFK